MKTFFYYFVICFGLSLAAQIWYICLVSAFELEVLFIPYRFAFASLLSILPEYYVRNFPKDGSFVLPTILAAFVLFVSFLFSLIAGLIGLVKKAVRK